MNTKPPVHPTLVAAALLGTLLFSGCASSPNPQNYVFAPTDGWRNVAVRDSSTSAFTVRFAPIHLPAYLDRPQIVTRITETEIKVDEFHRWGIPLNVTVTELLGASLARAISEAYVDVRPSRTRRADGYQVAVDIVRLDGFLGGTVELVAQWQVTKTGDTQESVLAPQLARYERECTGTTHEAYVNAIRDVVAALGTDIAKALQGVAGKLPASTAQR